MKNPSINGADKMDHQIFREENNPINPSNLTSDLERL